MSAVVGKVRDWDTASVRCLGIVGRRRVHCRSTERFDAHMCFAGREVSPPRVVLVHFPYPAFEARGFYSYPRATEYNIYTVPKFEGRTSKPRRQHCSFEARDSSYETGKTVNISTLVSASMTPAKCLISARTTLCDPSKFSFPFGRLMDEGYSGPVHSRKGETGSLIVSSNEGKKSRSLVTK